MELVNGILDGEQKALAQLITLVEEESAEIPLIMKSIHPHLGKAYCVGITGLPGAGKSTLVDKLTCLIRARGFSVGIIATDPTSPFSGGAVLGDRIRMQQHCLDQGVFIRSMATRGSHGGLPQTIRSVVKLMDASGKDFILVETVGVGQTELDIMQVADTTVVVLTPETGDAIQTLKAGLLEIADIFVVNKADREGADRLASALVSMLQLSAQQPWWGIPVLTTQAINNVGIEELYHQIGKHRQLMEETGRLAQKRQERRRKEFVEAVEQAVAGRLRRAIEQDGRLSYYLEKVATGELEPLSASLEVLNSPVFLENWLKGK